MDTKPGHQIEALVRSAAQGLWQIGSTNFLGVWDTELACPAVAELRELSARFYDENLSEGHGEAYDCEDISMAFAGLARAKAAQLPGASGSLACGLIMGRFKWLQNFGTLHVCCWTVVTDGGTLQLQLLEPQTRPDAGSTDGWLMPVNQARGIRLILV